MTGHTFKVLILLCFPASTNHYVMYLNFGQDAIEFFATKTAAENPQTINFRINVFIGQLALKHSRVSINFIAHSTDCVAVSMKTPAGYGCCASCSLIPISITKHIIVL